MEGNWKRGRGSRSHFQGRVRLALSMCVQAARRKHAADAKRTTRQPSRNGMPQQRSGSAVEEEHSSWGRPDCRWSSQLAAVDNTALVPESEGRAQAAPLGTIAAHNTDHRLATVGGQVR